MIVLEKPVRWLEATIQRPTIRKRCPCAALQGLHVVGNPRDLATRHSQPGDAGNDGGVALGYLLSKVRHEVKEQILAEFGAEV